MNYSKIYSHLIAKRVSDPVTDSYFEKHHIIPRCLGGTNHKWNIVHLTAREHFIAHLLLAKIHGGKLWIAAHYMAGKASKSAKGVKVNSRTYKMVRENHAAEKSKMYSGKKNPFFGKTFDWETIQKMRGPRPSVMGANNHNFGKKHPERGELIKFIKNYNPRPFDVDYTVMERIHAATGIIESVGGRGERYLVKTPELRKLKQYYSFMERSTGVRRYGKENANYGNGQAISGEKNPMFGKEHKESTKRKIGEKAKRRIVCPHCGKDGNIANMHRWHFDNCKVINANRHRPNRAAETICA